MPPLITTIFAIGGGELSELETLAIDKQIVAAAKIREGRIKSKPRALFIPTASGDDPEYYETFAEIYGRRLGCDTDVLYLYGGVSSKSVIAKKINWCDLVYVGGGSTPSMMRMWHKYNVDKMLKRAWKNGVMMAGLSAGANCWFSLGLSNAFKNRWTAVRCLGLVSFACNVHYSTESGRKKAFSKLIAKNKITGIALEDNACIKVTNDRYEIIKSRKNAEVFKIVYRQNTVKRFELVKNGLLADL